MNEDNEKTETDRSFRELANMNDDKLHVEPLEVLEKKGSLLTAKRAGRQGKSDVERLCEMLSGRETVSKEKGFLFSVAAASGYVIAETHFPWYTKVSLTFLVSVGFFWASAP